MNNWSKVDSNRGLENSLIIVLVGNLYVLHQGAISLLVGALVTEIACCV